MDVKLFRVKPFVALNGSEVFTWAATSSYFLEANSL